jgi:hypothetical protein
MDVVTDEDAAGCPRVDPYQVLDEVADLMLYLGRVQ